MFLCFCAKFQVSYIVIGREEKEEGGGGEVYIGLRPKQTMDYLSSS